LVMSLQILSHSKEKWDSSYLKHCLILISDGHMQVRQHSGLDHSGAE